MQHGDTIVVMGLGTSGRAALGLLKRSGFTRLIGVDRNPSVEPIEGVELQLGAHRRQTFIEADHVVVSPGVPPTQADLAAAREAGVPVIGEIALAEALAFDAGVQRVGITGTNGKSTVTHFTGQLLTAAGRTPFVGGNIGNSASNADLGEYDVYVLELSSYQLENAGGFRADFGVVLNLTPDHLARHGDMARYAEAKLRLFQHARETDVCMLPPADPWLTEARAPQRGVRASLGGTPGVSRSGNAVQVELDGRSAQFDLSGFGVPGEHNKDNAAVAAFAVWTLTGDAAAIQRGLSALTALEHRMQIVPTEDGLVWVNDSKSTNVDSTLAALRGRTDATVLLLGGEWKGTGYGAIVPLLEPVHTVICFGGNGSDIRAELADAGVESSCVPWLRDAVDLARERARTGDHILLSPGCASFDEFDNFAARGRAFMKMVTR